MADNPIPFSQHVADLVPITGDAARKIKLAAGINPALVIPEAAALMPAKLVTKPGIERWPVKTGADADVAEVGVSKKPDATVGFGLVDTTVEELTSIPRPSSADGSSAENHRVSTVETTVWRLQAEIITLKQESDGDYHLVLQGDSGDTMIGEVPTPRPPFVASTSPFLGDIKVARKWVDDNILSKSPAALTAVGQTLAPVASLIMAPTGASVAPSAITTPAGEGAQPTFKTKIRTAKATLIGVGFFDHLHGQTGVAPNGIELHPVLSIEFVKGGN
jgi:hypothetical protein